MIAYPLVTLGDLVSRIQYGLTARADVDQDGPVYIRITDVNESGEFRTDEPVRVQIDEKAWDKYRVQEGDLLIARSGTVGRYFVVPPDFQDAVFASYLIRFDLLPDLVLPEYMASFCRSDFYWQQIWRLARSAAQPNINSGELASIQVPLPPLSEQRRIVEIMQETEAVRRLRAEAARKTDDLIPAIFHDMFGDPAENPHEWPTRQLASLASKFSDGPFGSNLKSAHYRESGVRVIRLQNIGVGEISNEDEAYISEDHFDSLPRHECLPGDVLVATLGDPNLRACILPETIPRALNKADCVQFRPNKEYVNAAYVCWILNLPSTLRMAEGLIAGQTRSRISMGRLGTLPIPVPPLALQDRFARTVNEIDSSRQLFLAGKGAEQYLVQSLLAHAFTGDLTAAWRKPRKLELQREAAERDAALHKAGVILRKTEPPEPGPQVSQDLRLTELTPQQQTLVEDLQRLWKGGEQYAFTPHSIARESSDPGMRDNPDLVRRHLDVLAARGFVLRVSRFKEQKADDSLAVLYRRARRPGEAFTPEDAPEIEHVFDDVRSDALTRMAGRLREGK